jgi:hypothetical protein
MLALTSPTSGGRSVGIVSSWTEATEFVFFLFVRVSQYVWMSLLFRVWAWVLLPLTPSTWCHYTLGREKPVQKKYESSCVDDTSVFIVNLLFLYVLCIFGSLSQQETQHIAIYCDSALFESQVAEKYVFWRGEVVRRHNQEAIQALLVSLCSFRLCMSEVNFVLRSCYLREYVISNDMIDKWCIERHLEGSCSGLIRGTVSKFSVMAWETTNNSIWIVRFADKTVTMWQCGNPNIS